MNTQNRTSPKIIVYSCGDSRDICTWSNVPFLFVQALKKKGYSIVRVNIEPVKSINHLYNSFFFRLCFKILKQNASPIFARSRLHRLIVWLHLFYITKKHPNASLHLFLSYAFYNKFSSKPSVLWCDWPDSTVIQRLGRLPKWYEQQSLLHEKKVIQSADLVYSMFPCCAKDMAVQYSRKVLYLGKNVVNTIYNKEFDFEQNITKRAASKRILFIGNHRYHGAALQLIRTFMVIHNKMPNIELHIIGMTRSQLQLDKSASAISCYGYLRKNIPDEAEHYYELLHSAHVLVNPSPQWGAYSSTVEAMYYGCPVIVAPYKDFVADFGKKIRFGFYINNATELAYSLEKIFTISDLEYAMLCKNAHEKTAHYTWDEYVQTFLESLRSHGISI